MRHVNILHIKYQNTYLNNIKLSDVHRDSYLKNGLRETTLKYI